MFITGKFKIRVRFTVSTNLKQVKFILSIKFSKMHIRQLVHALLLIILKMSRFRLLMEIDNTRKLIILALFLKMVARKINSI